MRRSLILHPFRQLTVAVVLLLMLTTMPAIAASPPMRSSGCGSAPPETPPSVITVNGVERPVLIIAGDPDADTPHDLVVAFHGRTNSNTEVRAYYDLERHALRATLFVYPTGMPTESGDRSWSMPGADGGRTSDFALFDVIVLRLARLYCVDLGRIFAVGHSLGASFVDHLACARGGRLRAIATVAGDIGSGACSGPVAALLFHSPKDTLVPISRGESVRDRLLTVNDLRGPPTPLASGDLNCVRYGPADARTPVVWCAHDRTITRRGNYYPHQWPVEAGMLIMAFFASLP